jgi:hypothetical protein
MLERPMNELCAQADDRYRKTSRRAPQEQNAVADGKTRVHPDSRSSVSLPDETGLALRSAAMQAGEYDAFRRIIAVLAKQAPDTAKALGLHK